MSRNELLLAATLESVEVAEQFSKVPLHVTFLPWFQVEEDDQPKLDSCFQDIATHQQTIEITGQDEAMFGPEHETKVRKVSSKALLPLHVRLLQVIDDFGASHREAWIGQKFVPHVTYLDGKGLDRGQRATLRALQLFSRTTPNAERIVQAVYPFQARTGDAKTR